MSTEQRYLAEQERLRRELDGDPDDEFRIEIPKDPEVRPEVWKDVEPMLYRGFITASANMNGLHVTFKSLNHQEFSLLAFMGEFNQLVPPARFWNTFLSYAVFMFDGNNVLADRSFWLTRLQEIFGALPKGARDRLVRHLSELNRRASNAVRLTEAYATESASRYRWAQLRGMDLTTPAVTGIPGSEALGMNWAQLTWRALNHFEDMRETVEREWDNAKFIGSCLAGKGISKVYSQDTERRKKEREERLAKKDALLKHVLLGQPLDDGAVRKDGIPRAVARTVEDLAHQMESDLRGDRDFHDLVVEEHERLNRERVDEQRRQVEDLVTQREIEYEGRFLVGATGEAKGLSRAEVEQRITRDKAVQAQALAQRIVYPQNEQEEEFLQKWGGGPSTTVGYSDKDPQEVVAQPPVSRPPGKPFRR